LPPLCERKDDLSQLIEHFLKHYSAKHGRHVQRISPEARAVLKAYDYPGNARELANIIERAVIVAIGKKVEAEDLPAGLSAAVSLQQRRTKSLSLAQLEAVYISETLAANRGNKAECARILGISRKNLYEKIARYRLSTAARTSTRRSRAIGYPQITRMAQINSAKALCNLWISHAPADYLDREDSRCKAARAH